MDKHDPETAASLEDLAACLRYVHLRADRPTYRTLEQQTATDGGVLPGTRPSLKKVRLTRTIVSDVLAGRKFPGKAFLLTFVDACGIDLENDRRWEQAWDRLAIQYPQVSAAGGAEKLRQENEELRRQLTAAKRQAEKAENRADQAQAQDMNETQLTIVGDLVNNPELRFTPSGEAIARFRIASTPRYYDKQAGEWRDGERLFLTCHVWRQLAENVAESLQQGTRAIVAGKLRQRSYETEDGEKRTVYEVEVDEVSASLQAQDMNETQLTIVGDLVNNPELRFTPSGEAIARFRIASTPRYYDKQAGEWRDGETLFLTCHVWRQLAENVAESLQQGTRAIVAGKLRQRSYETEDGEKRTVYEVEVDEVSASLQAQDMNETQLTIVGDLVNNPELRFTPSGEAIARFRIASTPRYYDKQAGEWRDGERLFLTCHVWRQLAENVAESLQQGTRAIVAGKLRQRSYETEDGEKRTVYEVEVDEVGASLLNGGDGYSDEPPF